VIYEQPAPDDCHQMKFACPVCAPTLGPEWTLCHLFDDDNNDADDMFEKSEKLDKAIEWASKTKRRNNFDEIAEIIEQSYADYANDEEQQAENKLWDVTAGDGLEESHFPFDACAGVDCEIKASCKRFLLCQKLPAGHTVVTSFKQDQGLCDKYLPESKAELMKRLAEYDGDYEPEDVWGESVGEEVL